MESPAVIVFRLKDWPVARPLIDARQLPEVFEELACYLLSPAHTSRSTLEERLPEEPVEAPLAAMVMELLEPVSEVALECFGHELFDAGPVGQKHLGFHPSASYAQVASRFEKDGFRVLHASDLVRSVTAADPSAAEATRQRVRAIPKAGLNDREVALVEYVRSGGPMPQAGADHAAIALRLGELITPRIEDLAEIDGRILDVACAAGELRGVFKPFAARINAHEEAGSDSFGALRRELARRGIADGRILVALLQSGVEVTSSATIHVMARYNQLESMIESVRSSEPSRAEQAKLITRLLTWMSCVGTLPAALSAVTDLVESPRAKDLVTDELRAHLAATHGYEGPKPKSPRGRAAKGKAAEPETHKPAARAEAPKPEAPKPEAPKPEAPKAEAPKPAEPPTAEATKSETDAEAEGDKPRKPKAKTEKTAPGLTSVNETLTFARGDALVSLAEPGLEGDDEALLDAVNRKSAMVFRADLDDTVTVRITGRGLTAQEADHAFGSHHHFATKTTIDALELRVADEGNVIALPKGKYGVEVVAIRSPRPGAVPDYVLLLRDEAPARLAKRAELPLIPTG
ncbi:MAG: hypothetical protein U0326_09050 [Polyangiales bacterium]